MGYFLPAEIPPQEIVIQSPADIIMAAQVVQEYVLLRQGKHLAQLVFQQLHVPRGHSMPQGCHGGHIVQQVAFRFLHGTEIRNHAAGLHHNLAQQQRTRADDLAHHAHHPHQ